MFVFCFSWWSFSQYVYAQNQVSYRYDTLVKDTVVYELNLLYQWNNEELPSIGNQYFNDVWGWTAEDGSEYAIMGGVDSIYFFDISTPENTVLVDVRAGRSQNCVHRDFKTWKHYAYAVADQGNASLQIFDLSYLPDSVHVVYDEDSLVRRAHNIHINNEKLYLAAHLKASGERYALSVLSLANPEVPETLIEMNSEEYNYAHDVFVRNDTAYASNEWSGLFIYDFTEPTASRRINQITRYPQQGYNHSSWMTEDGQFLVFADENHGLALKVLDLRNMGEQLEVVSTFAFNREYRSIVHNPFIRDSLAFIAYYHEGLQVFDLSDPLNPKYLTGYDTYPDLPVESTRERTGFEGCWGNYPFFPSGTIVASDMTYGLHVFRLEEKFTKDTQLVVVDSFGGNVLENCGIDWQLAPNPFQDDLRLILRDLNTSEQRKVQLSVFNLQGKWLFDREWAVTSEQQIHEVRFPAHLPNAMYPAKITIDGCNIRHLKLVKQGFD